jgi:hypothetical protein
MRGLPEKRRVESENLKNKSPTPTPHLYERFAKCRNPTSQKSLLVYGGDGDAPKAARFGQGASRRGRTCHRQKHAGD